ncbi:pyrokinin-1 receptor-like [Uloborus diversus]|uniref:pyrokinin-1 receptor-like n=1 Tax=Uloborus diversus TaxID=327109 RepID=UPI00240A21E9|nr:pyrokinin-1 receptor-like [Uloborus diversus]
MEKFNFYWKHYLNRTFRGNNGTFNFLDSDFWQLSDNFTSDEEEIIHLPTVISMTIVYAVLLVTGTVGNVCTCVVISRNRYMHTATNYYLFSLSISDLLLLTLGLPQEMYQLWIPRPYTLGESMCIVRGFTAEASTYASILTITAFTVERYVAICHPLKAHALSSLSRAVKITVAIWVLSAVCAVPVCLQFGVIYDTTINGEVLLRTAVCSLERPIQHAFLISFLLFFCAPLVMIFTLYIKIGFKLKGSMIMDKLVAEKMRSSTTSYGSGHENGKSNVNNNRKGIIKMLVAVVVSFFLCWLPFHVQRLMATYVVHPTPFFNLAYTVVTYLSGITYYVSATLNPILYQLMSLKFQQAFKDTFGSFKTMLVRVALEPLRISAFLENILICKTGASLMLVFALSMLPFCNALMFPLFNVRGK